MDMNDGMPMPMGGNETMTPFMHFSMTDPLWFEAWVPMGAGATVGACIGLFFIAMIERLLNGMRGVMESWWRRKADELLAARSAVLVPTVTKADSVDEKHLSEDNASSINVSVTSVTRVKRRLPPFILAHDFTRGVIYAVQATIAYGLMLAVMTYNTGYFIAIVFGLGVGEVLFGRFSRTPDH